MADVLCGLGLVFAVVAGFRAWEPVGWAVLAVGCLWVGFGLMKPQSAED